MWSAVTSRSRGHRTLDPGQKVPQHRGASEDRPLNPALVNPEVVCQMGRHQGSQKEQLPHPCILAVAHALLMVAAALIF